jgi:hypothetical protein
LIHRLRELADRPIADRHRRRLFLACAAALLGVAALLLLAGVPGPTSPPSPTRTSAERPAPATPPQTGFRPSRSPRETTRGGARAARRFLLGYLPFLYGQGSRRAIDDASSRLLGRLARSRIRVPPAARRRHPRVVELDAKRLGAGRAAVTATVDDGGVSRYPIELTLATRRGRWLVAAVGAD